MSNLVSFFIPQEQIKALKGETRFPNTTEQEVYEKVIEDMQSNIGRVTNYERIMGHFPLYLEKHYEVMQKFFYSELSISHLWRYYIAYMASATHRCEYLMRLEEHFSRTLEGDWFENSNDVPSKLKSLGKANAKLAHRPWEFTGKDVKELLTQWNPNELVLVLTELCQFHCLSGFVFGVGVAPEEDLPLVNFREPLCCVVKPTRIKTNIADKLRGLVEQQEYDDISAESLDDIHGYEDNAYFSRIAGDSLCYINYPMDEISRPFNGSEFSLTNQAYFVLEKMVPEVSESIWNRIRLATVMTYDYVGQDSGVETGPLRRAIWNYVQRVYGLQYDDYNYTDINKFLEINTKKYIKKIACFPETVTKQDWENIELDLTYDEMIHLNILICEARFETELLYMLYAIGSVYR
ncbi:hypothetical protein SteCoe_29633 [Stentor coeruleus]|uniref:Uncharacterized protein n=1 Tax=Stentor coeruleus TaxID=5963 RepID=A0A1R2B5W3_9CILI|nr:hypothetical protein SteCoe_29633 [Stentor coeruleus]